MSFIESPRFPTSIGLSRVGGPTFVTEVVTPISRKEQRNSKSTQMVHRYRLDMPGRDMTEAHTILTFFAVSRGRFRGFRIKDHVDFNSLDPSQTITALDQRIGVGDGVETQFQLIKTYSVGGFSIVRTILKPVDSTTLVAVDGTPLGGGFTVNTVTGIVTFDVAPGNGLNVDAGYEFDVPVRPTSDDLDIRANDKETASVPNFEVIEMLNP